VAGDVDIVWAPDFQRQAWGLAEPYLGVASLIVESGMKRRIPRSRDGSHGRPPGYAASRIRQLERGVDEQGPYRDVGTDATSPDGYSYPRGLEHGTKAHTIRSKGAYPLRNPRTGQVFGRVVNHPGTKPYPWARPAAYDLDGRVL
jgi:hypothetical protein